MQVKPGYWDIPPDAEAKHNLGITRTWCNNWSQRNTQFCVLPNCDRLEGIKLSYYQSKRFPQTAIRITALG